MLSLPLPDALAAYPVLERLSAAGVGRLARFARPVEAGPGLFHQEGDACAGVTLLARGLVRVGKRRANGREIGLYTVEPGGLCVLEVLAVLTGQPYRAEAVIDVPVQGVVLPGADVRELVDREPVLRDLLFRTFEARLAMALDLVSDVALGTLEGRLAGTLLRLADAAGAAGPEEPVRVTHERLAAELACAREAVSRTMGAWERAGMVRLGRAQLWLLDRDGLARLAGIPSGERGRMRL